MINKKIKKYSSNYIIKNKNAQYKYFIEKKIEAGISLQGWEVKSIRAGKINITNSYILIKNKEAYLFGANFEPLITISSNILCNPTRTKKLLLNKKEINFLNEYIKRKGYTLIPLIIYWKNIWIKIKIGIAKGKKEYDKRNSIKKREWESNKARTIKI